MRNVLQLLRERGFVQQVTHEEELEKMLQSETVTAYVGFDPTADSLHLGHLLPLIALKHLQEAGHRPIVLLGGGTAMIGDPTGKTEMRKLLSQEQIAANAEAIRRQVDSLLGHDRVLVLNNADWLLPLNYVTFLREIGVHFSVNRMLTAECFRTRWERGLSFIEFNYMLLQAYDFLTLYRRYGCRLQMGGDDQWSNILAGADLIRRVEGVEAYGLTFPLLVTSSGKKMGKTEAGAVWLDANKTSPYEFYQYWRNVEDSDVGRFLALYTFLPMEEVRRLAALPGEEINEAKRVLAYEVTRLVHGKAAAEAARDASDAFFGGGRAGDGAVSPGAGAEGRAVKRLLPGVPTVEVSREELARGIPVLDLLVRAGLVSSRSEGRRLIDQRGIEVNGERVESIEREIGMDDVEAGLITLRKGKKTYRQVVVVDK
ncbi:MAG: tyrosine--tRNA ligase [Limnochordales bacterium]|nr:tyrosine--tRNA ligase [Limnochordales bacterium]